MTNKDFIKFISSGENFAYVNGAANPAERERRKLELKKRFDAGFSSATANFSNPAVEDIGNESGIYDDCSTFAEYSAKAREVSAFGRIKSLVAVSNVRESAKQWALQKNEIRRRNNAKQKEKEKAAQNPNISKPFWF